jgi:hypothetical protein
MVALIHVSVLKLDLLKAGKCLVYL